jgi:hypothetical protein
VQPLLEIREELEDLLDRQPAFLDLRRQEQVFLDIEAREDASLLGTYGQPESCRSCSMAAR